MAETTTLIQDGPFAHTRNPMYLGMILILAGIALLLGSFSPLTVPPVFVVLIRQRFVLPEERKLQQIFKAKWEEYAGRVRRWL